MKHIIKTIAFLGFLITPALNFAATITVTSELDTLSSGDGACTLREAIFNANSNTSTYGDCASGSWDDEIIADSSVTTICLNDTVEGDLDISDNLIITATFIIDGGSTAAGGTTTCATSLGDRIFDVASGISATFNGVTVKGGYQPLDDGGGIYGDTSSQITVVDSTISGNWGDYGGGIYGPDVIVENSVVSGNVANLSGGGLFITRGTLTLENSTVSGNTAGDRGGGIYSSSTLSFQNSTISENTAVYDGGGIYSGSTGELTLESCTVSGNVAENGGGIITGVDYLSINNSTIAANTATDRGGGLYYFVGNLGTITNSTIANNIGEGGGFYNTGILEVKNTIVAENVDSSNSPNDCDGLTFTSGYDFISVITCPIYTPTIGDITDGLNLYLDALANNGGPTETMSLDALSVAVNGGDCTVATDQRGQARDATCDIGAYEYINQAPVANAGNSGRRVFGIEIYANGINSSDPDGDAITYAWSFSRVPRGSALITQNIMNRTIPRIGFSPDVRGFYTLLLTVSDPYGLTSTATVTFNVR